jgi:membrane dipeptidase
MRTFKRNSVVVGAALALIVAGCATTTSPPDTHAIHNAALVLDSHADVLLPETARRYYAPDGGSRTSLAQLTSGGVDAIVLSIAVGSGPETPEGFAAAGKEADAKLSVIRNFINASGGKVEQARTADDVERIQSAGHIAVILGFQNARILGGDLGAFDHFYEAGVRVAALTHAGNNAFADSSRPQAGETERHHGLSPFGKDAIRRFNDLGVLFDVSQLSTPALLQAIAMSRAPVVATHSNARALVDNARNLSDAELDAIKANGGVVQLTPFGAYVHKPTPAELAKPAAIRAQFGLSPSDSMGKLAPTQREQLEEALRVARPRGTLNEYVDHIDYIVRRIGADHVGIGTDFNHGAGIDGFDGEKDAPNVTAELVRRGYTQKQINAIWGGNFLRVLRAAQAAAAPAAK